MFPDLCTRMKHSAKDLPRNQTIIVNELDGADGSFVCYHFLTLFLRSTNGIVYIFALRHSRSHYESVLAKLGVRLKNCIEQNRFKIFDLTSTFANDEKNISSDFCLSDQTKLIEEDFKDFIDINKPFLFLIDDISVLLDLTNNFRQVFNFIQQFRKLTLKNDGVFVAVTCSYQYADNETDNERVSAIISHYANWLIKIKPLTTGWAKDVQGEVKKNMCFFSVKCVITSFLL